MRCTGCEAVNPDDAKFCAECGRALAVRCPKCGHNVLPNAKFCGECGTPLTAPAPAAKPEPAVTGERRHLTVLFCDLVGSTEIASRLDPEQWHAIASDYQRDAAAAVERFGGHVAKYLGDGLVVYFGYPKAMEDAAERAVRAGLAIVEATAKLNARFASAKVDLQVRVGIHSGSVVVAQGGGRDADMFGDAPNIAARVQTAAAPGTVFITEETHALVSGLFVVEDNGAQPLKGIAQAVRLYRVAGAGVSRRRGFAAGALTPFVGREDEMQLLARRWERARDGEGQMVLLMGEPGIGKSRVVEEFRAHIRSEAHLWVACACEELFNNTPFHAMVQMLDQGLGWRGDESREERAAQLERALRATGAKLDEALPLIAELLGIALAQDYPALKYTAEQKRRRLFAALAGWVFGAARIQPLVMVIEDLHWVDPSTLEFLQMLAEQGATAPLLLLCTSRPEFRSPWPMRAHHAQLTLNRLNDRQTREMVAGVVARSGMLAEVIEGVIRRTDGVPLFAEELARLMLESPAASGEIPATLQDSLTARLDRLGPAKDVAQIGSVIGREFSYELLQAVSGIDEGALQTALTRLADAELILARGVPPDATYQFKHALIQDAAYHALLKSRRAELHGRIAQTIVDKFPRLGEAQPQILARHWSDAGRIEPAVAAWTRAAKAADARSAFREAEEAYGRALALLSTLPETPERDASETEILTPLIVVSASIRSWSADEVMRLSGRAEALALKTGNLMQLVLQRFAAAMSAGSSGDIARGRAVADQLSELAQREGSDFALRCAHEAQIATRYNASDFAEVEEYYAAWLQLCERAGYGPFAGEVPNTLGAAAMGAWHRGFSDTARERIDRAVAFARQSSNPTDLMIALERKATLHLMQKVPEIVAEAAGEGLALSQAHGLASSIPSFSAKLSWAKAHFGDAAAHVPVMRESIALMQRAGGGHHDALLRLAHVLNLAGAEDESLAAVESYLKDLPDSLNARPNAYQLRGELHRKAGRDDLAEKDFRQSIAVARQIGTKFVELRAATSLGRIMQARGDVAAALDLVEPLYAAFTEGFDTADLKDAKAFLDALGAGN